MKHSIELMKILQRQEVAPTGEGLLKPRSTDHLTDKELVEWIAERFSGLEEVVAHFPGWAILTSRLFERLERFSGGGAFTQDWEKMQKALSRE